MKSLFELFALISKHADELDNEGFWGRLKELCVLIVLPVVLLALLATIYLAAICALQATWIYAASKPRRPWRDCWQTAWEWNDEHDGRDA